MKPFLHITLFITFLIIFQLEIPAQDKENLNLYLNSGLSTSIGENYRGFNYGGGLGYRINSRLTAQILYNYNTMVDGSVIVDFAPSGTIDEINMKSYYKNMTSTRSFT